MHFLLHMIVSWLVSALALWIVAQIIPGIEVRNFKDAMIATVIIAVVSVLLKPILSFFALPFIILTLGLFMVIINAILLWFASLFTPGFRVRGFFAALIGSVVLTVLTWILRQVVF
jgi:putative membrane protein